MEILSSATSLKYTTKFTNIFAQELANPTDDFIILFTKKILEGRRITSPLVKEFGDIIKRGANQYINELISQKLKLALKTTNQEGDDLNNERNSKLTEQETIVTTQEELEGYYIIKSIVGELIDSKRIYCKDTFSYFSILLDNKVTKWFARLSLNGKQKYLILITTTEKTEDRIKIDSVEDIYKYKNNIIKSLKLYL